jgi:hypothetical protein
MSLLDELNIRYTTINDDVWVNIGDLSGHLLKTVNDFAKDSVAYSWNNPLKPTDAMFLRGITEGMLSVIALLAQGGVEAEFHEKVNTVEDLINIMKKNKDSL